MVIPAAVMYDKRLPPAAKILYGEISALCRKLGFCWAGNAYFAKRFAVSERSVLNWINSLRKAGYISVSFTYIPGKKEVDRRLIRLVNNAPPPPDGDPSGDDLPGGNTSVNTERTGINNGQAALPAQNEAAVAPRLPRNPPGPENTAEIPSGGTEKIFATPRNNLPEVVKIPSKGGEKMCGDNTTSYLKTTTTPNGQKVQNPGPAAAALLSPADLKAACSRLNKNLLFDPRFYPRAAAFMAANALPLNYLSWLYQQCLAKRPRSLAGLFYTLFFSANMTELFLSLHQPPPPTPPPVPVICPVCGTSHPSDASCPACGLSPYPSPEEISSLKEIYSLPADKRKAFLAGQAAIFAPNNGRLPGFSACKALIQDLRRQFGLTLNP